MALADFFTDMLPYAQRASAELDIPVSVILSQWANESNYGRSNLALNAKNYGGIKDTGRYQKYGAYAKYPSINDFVDDYIRVMNLGYYKEVRQANTVDETLKALGKSPYAESGYGGEGQWLKSIINQFGLTKYDDLGRKDSGLRLPDFEVTDEKLTYNIKGLDNNAIAWGLVAIAGLMVLGNISKG